MTTEDSKPSTTTKHKLISGSDLLKMMTKSMSMDYDSRDTYKGCFIEDYKDVKPEIQETILAWEIYCGTENKLFFSIFEAADIAKLHPSTLLHAGGNGGLTLCTPVPPGISVLPQYGNMVGQALHPIELLSLTSADCRCLEMNNYVNQSNFQKGYTFVNNEEACVLPGYLNYEFMYDSATWSTYHESLFLKITITIEQLFIPRMSLCQFLDRLVLNGNTTIQSAINPKIKRKRQDALAAIYIPMLEAEPNLTATQLMTKLLKEVGKPHSCILSNNGDGLQWEPFSGKPPKQLTLKNLENRVTTWRRSQKYGK